MDANTPAAEAVKALQKAAQDLEKIGREAERLRLQLSGAQWKEMNKLLVRERLVAERSKLAACYDVIDEGRRLLGEGHQLVDILGRMAELVEERLGEVERRAAPAPGLETGALPAPAPDSRGSSDAQEPLRKRLHSLLDQAEMTGDVLVLTEAASVARELGELGDENAARLSQKLFANLLRRHPPGG